MEALDSDADEEISTMAIDDTEMVHLPKAMYYEILDSRGEVDLPADLYTLPDMIKPEQNQGHSVEQDAVIDEKKRKDGKPKWGPLLVEPRPSRGARDGRSMLKKA
jgi:hypothetical protein